MRVLVLGNGQLGTELARAPWEAGAECINLGHAHLDITDRAAVVDAVGTLRSDLVVNAAAYTAVDRAESEPETAFAVNRDGAAHVAEACARARIPLVHVSTDFVFDGAKNAPYVEEDPVAPLNVYGLSKEAGERAVRERLGKHFIIRTSWLFSAHGRNFVKAILNLAASRPELRVVADQIGRPTSAADLASAITTVGVQALREPTGARFGTYHFAGAGATSWHGFAEAIVAAQVGATGHRPPVRAITSGEHPTPARRPPYSALDSRRIEQVFGVVARPWCEGLQEVIADLLGGSNRGFVEVGG